MRAQISLENCVLIKFQIPMRGYERDLASEEEVLYKVPNPHEGL